MRAIEISCPVCGERNPAATEFCLFCGGYLWEPSAAPVRPAPVSLSGAVSGTVSGVAAAAPTTPSLPDEDAATADETRMCPRCGRDNPVARHFCGRCGHAYDLGARAPAVPPPSGLLGWWRARWDSRDRAARRAYRRSLPATYRWRRGIVALVVAAVAVVGVVVSQRNPAQLARAAWYELKPTYVTVRGVGVAVEPATGSVRGSDPAALVDQSLQEWTMVWKPKRDGTCAGAPGTASIVLSFPATRIRKLAVRAGLAPTNPDRPAEARPRLVGVTYPGQPCRPYELPDGSGELASDLPADSGVPVTSVTLALNSVYPGTKFERRVSWTEVTLKSFPTG